jgi:hypothetical protein
VNNQSDVSSEPTIFPFRWTNTVYWNGDDQVPWICLPKSRISGSSLRSRKAANALLDLQSFAHKIQLVVFIMATNPPKRAKKHTKKQPKVQGGWWGTGWWKLTAEARAAGLAQVKAKVAELGLNTDPARCITIVGKMKDGTVGTDAARDSSIKRYEKHWNKLLDFCLLIGDIESAIIVYRANCPSDPPPVKLDTAIHCLRFFTFKQDEPLLHHRTNRPITDLLGNPLMCCGQWRSFHTISLYRTALTKVHSHHDTTQGDYIEACDDCKALGMEGIKNGQGCVRHISAPRFWRSGNTGQSKTFKTKYESVIDYAKSHYNVRATIALLPFELRLIRTNLLSENTNYDLMIWTIILFATKGFLRVQDEALTLDWEQFKDEYFVVNEHDVEGLCFTVNGKEETEDIYLMSWDDKDCPDFSPSRAMLIWIAFSGIEGGYLFPSQEQIGQKKPTMHLSYSTFLQKVKYLFQTVLGKKLEIVDTDVIIGTHMCRHTAYLLAYWGLTMRDREVDNTLAANLAQSARHADPKMMMTYLGDAATLQELAERTPEDATLDNTVGLWKSIHVNTHSSFGQLNLSSRKWQRPLAELAKWYIFDLLAIPNGWSSIAIVCGKVCHFEPDTTIKGQYTEILQKNLSPQVAQQVLALIETNTASVTRHAVQQASNSAASAFDAPTFALLPPEPAPATLQAADPASVTPPAPKRQRCENMVLDRDYQEDLKRCKRADLAGKVQVCVDGAADIIKQSGEGKILPDNAIKSWFYRAASIAQCVEQCHSNSIADFVRCNPTCVHSRFSNSTCSEGKKHKVTLA